MTEPSGEDLEHLRTVDQADVFKAGQRAATLTRTRDGVEFRYLDDWITAGGPAVATTLPVTTEPVVRPGGALAAYFTGLLPEGRRLGALRRAVKTSADDELTLLLAVGADAIGDVQVVPAGVRPAEVPARVALEQINATLLYYWKMKQDVTAVGASIVSFVTGLADAVDHGDLELDPVQREIDSAQSLFERETAPERLLAGDLTSGLASAAGSAGPGQEIQVPTRLVRLKGQDLQASGGLLQTAKDLADTLALDARVFSDKGQAAYRAYEASRLRLWRKFGTGAPFHNILGAGYIKYADVHDSIDIDTAMKIGGR